MVPWSVQLADESDLKALVTSTICLYERIDSTAVVRKQMKEAQTGLEVHSYAALHDHGNH